MRQLACLLVAALLIGPGLVRAQEKAHDPAAEKKDDHGRDEHGGKAADQGKDAHAKDGAVNHDPPKPRSVLEIMPETAIWTVVIFVGLFLILSKYAWPPILEGMKKREASIEAAIEEAKVLRAENAKSQADLQKKLDEAYAEIPRLMDQARKDAEALKEKIRTEAAAEVQQDRQRLLREVDTAKDQALHEIWSQAAQLATLISTKVVGRSMTPEDHRRLVDEATADLREKTAR
jgi:F-type H+-transporting ATPase subunit b